MLVGPRDNNNNKTSWILNWFSQLTQSGRSNDNATDIIPASSPSNLAPQQQATTTTLDEDTPPPTPPPERRGSQQTVSTTRTFFSDSDDQYSTLSSARRRSSSERSMLKELWLKARKHHPHYPRFHWPSRNNHHRRHHHHHHHHHHLIFDPTMQKQQQNELTTHSITSSCSQRLSYDETMMIRADSSSCQELLHPHNKRHSITSLVSGDRITFASRPASIFCSQPASPMLSRTASRHNDNTSNDTTTTAINGDAAVMDDLYSRINDDTRENGIHFLPDRWFIKPELVQLALDNG